MRRSPATAMRWSGFARQEGGPMLGLPFEEIVLIDFEFRAPPGERPTVVCMVAREMVANRTHRLWLEGEPVPAAPPFRTDSRTLFVAFFASAEWGCFLQLGWDLPDRILDLYAEFRVETNGLYLPGGRSLLSAMSYHSLTSISKDEKRDMRDLVMRGGPYSRQEVTDILDYCESDVVAMAPLLERMLPAITARDHGLGRALLRGRYTAAVARIEHAGIPLDTDTLDDLRAHWDDIKADLIEEVDRDYGVYDGQSFRASKFQAYLDREGIGWPRRESGGLILDSDTFRDMAKIYPQVTALKELRSSLGELRLMDLSVGSDCRNRTLISPFSSRTGRNQPSNTRFIFGPSVWIRSLIVPPARRAMAYLDWKSQEVAIAAAMSGDAALIEAIESGDPYLSFAVKAGLAPEGATKETHSEVRDFCKVAVLGTNYGMGVGLLAHQTGLSRLAAADVLHRLKRTYPVYFKWAEDNVHRAQLTGSIQTVLGWPLHVTPMVKPNSLLNFPMQSNGAEMLRLACCLATEAGITVNAPVHDALLIEADEDRIEEAVAATSDLMTRAATTILGGMSIGTDAYIIRSGERYTDKRGVAMWGKVTNLVRTVKGGT